jgi:hypothetical protein
MAMAAARPGALGAVVLNDIGPVLEAAGLARIIAYVGRMPLPRDWNEAAAQVRSINRRDFTALSDAEWEEFARQVFNEENGRPAPAYDKSLAKAISIGWGPGRSCGRSSPLWRVCPSWRSAAPTPICSPPTPSPRWRGGIRGCGRIRRQPRVTPRCLRTPAPSVRSSISSRPPNRPCR